ncbi:hypothetical protein EPI10_030909 [Gossypium australe]|uniref:Uncharacterized protein n=1 Tax=Gossypium australe TaxID=47621 RepID=A0A5B6X000_9ROSI|nr:hypothetical protein EPI10_030909 [Gossypium australe]
MWWACKNNDRRWAMLAWDKICYPKGMRASASETSIYSTLPYLADKCGDYLQTKTHYATKFLLPNTSQTVDKSSLTWGSIATTARKLGKGFGCLIGDGEKVDIHSNNWGSEGLNGDSFIFKEST